MIASYEGNKLSGDGWSRGHVQIGGALFFGLLAPYMIAALISPRLPSLPVFQQSFGGTMIAIVIAFYFFRSLIAYPGIQASYYIIPVFSATFASEVVVLLLARLAYSRSLILLSYAVCIGWYYIVYFMIQRQPVRRIGVVPFGDITPLIEIGGATWLMLDSPRPPSLPCTAIVADFRADMPEEWESLLADLALEGTPVLHVKQLQESLTGRVEIEHLSENARGTLVPQPAYRNVKLIVDIIVSAILLVVLVPFFLVVAVCITRDSPGPVFFRQTRIGYRGTPFRVWKFRTMTHVVQSASRATAMTQQDDARITRIGRFLRRTRIDELPQLLNVIAGQMSLIGPRPEAEILSRWYKAEIPFYRYRHIVRPGITGWAQVSQGHVAGVQDVTSKLHYDFYYIANYSLWIDILIMFRTIRTIVTGFGSK